MTLWYPDYKLAPNWDNFGDLATLEGTEAPDGLLFPYPNAYFKYSPGEVRTRADGTYHYVGFPYTDWGYSYLTKSQVRYIQDTYCNGGYSGKVTVQTRTDDPDFYQIFNAVLLLPKHSDSSRRGKVFVDYALRFARLIPIGAAFDDGFSLGFES